MTYRFDPWQAAAPRVIIESPYSGDVARNTRYLRACLRDSIMRGEAPFASHGLYTQPGVLRDEDPKERETGIFLGFAWRAVAVRTVIYIDLGWSSGMNLGRSHASLTGHPIEVRTLGGEWSNQR